MDRREILAKRFLLLAKLQDDVVLCLFASETMPDASTDCSFFERRVYWPVGIQHRDHSPTGGGRFSKRLAWKLL